MILRNNLYIVRMSQGVTLLRLSELVGISRQALSNIENGRSVPKIDTCLNIARALDVSISDLWYFDDSQLTFFD